MNIRRWILRDRNVPMAEAWTRTFGSAPDVEISSGDIFDVRADAIVSPANSFGFMDGGIDLAYSQRFGWDLQRRLQDLLAREHDGELPVGQAVVVETGDPEIPFLVSAPTMRVPMDVSRTPNAYLAFRAAIRAVKAFDPEGTRIRSVLCPGLATSVGRMPYPRAARQMYAAYLNCVAGEAVRYSRLGEAADGHYHLVG